MKYLAKLKSTAFGILLIFMILLANPLPLRSHFTQYPFTGIGITTEYAKHTYSDIAPYASVGIGTVGIFSFSAYGEIGRRLSEKSTVVRATADMHFVAVFGAYIGREGHLGGTSGESWSTVYGFSSIWPHEFWLFRLHIGRASRPAEIGDEFQVSFSTYYNFDYVDRKKRNN